jgi:hypothetical protein
MRLTFLLCITLTIAACAIGSTARLERFETTSQAYERAIRWSDMRSAFSVAGNPEAAVPDFQRLENVRVTSYDVVAGPSINDDASRIAQRVQINYVNKANMADRSLMDEQVWIYVSNEKRWKLTSPFPAFR